VLQPQAAVCNAQNANTTLTEKKTDVERVKNVFREIEVNTLNHDATNRPTFAGNFLFPFCTFKGFLKCKNKGELRVIDCD